MNDAAPAAPAGNLQNPQTEVMNVAAQADAVGAGQPAPPTLPPAPPGDPKVALVRDCARAVYNVAAGLASPDGSLPAPDADAVLLWPSTEHARERCRADSGHGDKFPGTRACPKPSAHFFNNIKSWVGQMEKRRDAHRGPEARLAALEAALAAAEPGASVITVTDASGDSDTGTRLEREVEVAACRTDIAKAREQSEKWRCVPPLPALPLAYRARTSAPPPLIIRARGRDHITMRARARPLPTHAGRRTFSSRRWRERGSRGGRLLEGQQPPSRRPLPEATARSLWRRWPRRGQCRMRARAPQQQPRAYRMFRRRRRAGPTSWRQRPARTL